MTKLCNGKKFNIYLRKLRRIINIRQRTIFKVDRRQKNKAIDLFPYELPEKSYFWFKLKHEFDEVGQVDIEPYIGHKIFYLRIQKIDPFLFGLQNK